MSRNALLTFACLVSTALLAGAGCTRPEEDTLASASYSSTSPRVRKNAKALTAQERQDFVDAVLRLKQVPSPYDPTGKRSYYDQFVEWHLTLYRCDPLMPGHGMKAHGGPVFLPWHREYLLLFENALREVSGKDVTVPYWDWADAEATAAVFSDGLMGGDGDPADGYAVKTGPFRKGQWELVVQPIGIEWAPSGTTYLTRSFGTLPSTPTLPTAQEVAAALTVPHYDVPPYDTTSDHTQSFRNYMEGYRDAQGVNTMRCGPDGVMLTIPFNTPTMHNQVHGYVGGVIGYTPEGVKTLGTMLLPTSPNDPVFFLHHANIDRLWARWQQLHGVSTYQPISGEHGNNVNDPMAPYDSIGLTVTPASVEDLTVLGYQYQ